MVREVPLTQGKVALVDDDDYDRVMRHKWFAVRNGKHWYGKRCIYVDGKIVNCYIHRFILGVPDAVPVDHRNGDGLDCRKDNMRVASPRENAWNVRIGAKNTSGYKGVGRYKDGWKATIRKDGRAYTLTGFASAEFAAYVYDAMARRLFGEFASPNIPIPDPDAERLVADYFAGARRKGGTVKLTPAQVAEIKRRRSAGEPVKEIAAAYGVKIANVYHICSGRSWKEVAA